MSTIHSPTLPPELWWHILRTATSVEGAFDTPLRSPLDLEWRNRPEFWPRSMDDPHTKDAISMVCKTWRDIALEFLLETLSFDINTLGKIPESFQHGPHRHVRYLEVHGMLYSTDSEQFQHVQHLLQVCENIIVYKQTFSTFDTTPTPFAPPFVEHVQYLRRLVLQGGNLPSHFPSLISTVAPHLEILSVAANDEDVITPSTITLPSLHTLTLQFASNLCESTWRLPHLKRLNIYHISPDSLPSLLTALPKHANMLSIGRSEANQLQSILDLFSTVEILEVVVPSGEIWRDLTGPYPSLRQIGLRYQTGEWTNVTLDRGRIQNASAAFLALTNRSKFPNLECIRCCDFDLGKYRNRIEWLSECEKKLEELCIRLEGPEGELAAIGDVMADEVGWKSRTHQLQ